MYTGAMTELLAPAGNPESLDAAIGEGADAVYVGLKSFNARLRSSNFAWREFEAAVQSVHRMGRKIYVTVNTVCEEHETERLYRLLSYLNKIGPDGLIVQDFGVVRMCQEFFPGLELHASTQMNVESAAAANLLCRQGIKRVVLARELGLDEIKSIRDKTGAQLEIFVHGALCVSESGLCLFSSFLGGKSANRGMCTQACRRFYSAEVSSGSREGYYFSPCDMQLISHVPALMQMGIESFKIEGRMKSADYVGAVTAAYRYVMDHWEQDRKGSIAEGRRILSTDFARAKTDYWYGFKTVQDGVEEAGQKILNPDQAGGTGIYLGNVSAVRDALDHEKAQLPPGSGPVRMALIRGGSYDPDPGDSIRLHRSDDTGRESHKVRVVTMDDKGRRWVDIPPGFSGGDSVYLLQTKSMGKRYRRVLPQDLSRFRRQPGAERLPVMDLTPLDKSGLPWFPEGVWAQVSTIADAHTIQALHPVRTIIELNRETEYDLLNKDSAEKPILPVSKKMTVISLDPFFAEGGAEHGAEVLDALFDRGYRTFVVNNLAHINLLRGKDGVRLIAGPYLYTFNRWAVSFLENQNIMAFQMPYENSARNLEQTFIDAQERSRVLIPVFAYPALFRMRFKMPASYDFTYFSDKEDMGFKVNSTDDGSFVVPEVPFSIADKISVLKGKGWKRFLVDFSKTKVGKSDTRALLSIMQGRSVIPQAHRFNWKDGFYDPEKLEAYQKAAERNAAASAGSAGGAGKGRKSPRPQKSAGKGTGRR